MSFAKLRQRSKQALENLKTAQENERTSGYSKDDRFWTLTVNEKGAGSAEIRFLPPVEGEEIPYVRRYEYFVKHNGKYYVNYCRTTLGKNEKDPMNEHFFQVRGDGSDEEAKKRAREFARSTNYIANIYVINDPAHPENNGKVFLFKFGQRLKQKIEAVISPEFEDQEPFNPFDLWEGANFKLRARKLDGQRSYDLSEFDARGPLSEDDDEMEEIYNKVYPLLPEIAPDKFKSYEELKKELDYLLAAPGQTVKEDDPDLEDFKPKKATVTDSEDEPTITRKSETKAKESTASSSKVDDDEEAMNEYLKLISED